MTQSKFQPVTGEVTFYLVQPGSSKLPVKTELRFNPIDPYAMQCAFHSSGYSGDEVVWTFSRQLLADGITRPVGEGDVQIWPSPDCEYGKEICLSLSSPNGSALFEMPLDGVRFFLSRTDTVVRMGEESDYIDFDAELALLFWSDGRD